MKKLGCILTVVMVLTFLLVGCGKKPVTTGIQQNVPSNLEQNNSNNIIQWDKVKVGDKVLGLTVKTVNVDKESQIVNDITFSGEITVSGTYEYTDTGDGEGLIFTIAKEDVNKLPTFKNYKINDIKINDASNLLKGEKPGKIRIAIADYSIGERQIMASANLVGLVLSNSDKNLDRKLQM